MVVAADRSLAARALDDASFRVVDVPSTLVPPGALTAIEEVAGRVLATDLAEGEVLTETRLAGAGSGPLAALVPPGLRAFVLPTGPPAGTVRSGDEVDVLATYGANAGRPYTETVASALEVLDVVETDAPVASAGERAARGSTDRRARRPAHGRAARPRLEPRAALDRDRGRGRMLPSPPVSILPSDSMCGLPAGSGPAA